jgi:hypothetical protein
VGAQEMDARYHLAKLFGLMMSEEGAKLAWDEHRALRESLLVAQQPAAPRPAHAFADVMRVHRRLVDAGLVPPRSEEVH